ncbi:MAG: translation initiation factor IF-3, partial [Pyrinomonadaceae bacterium]
AKRWLSEGDKVRAAIAFRGREMTHRELGAKILARLTTELAEYGDIEVAPKMEGYQMFTILAPKKSKAAITKHTSVAPNKGDEVERPKKAAKPAAPKVEKPKTEDDEDDIF